ncbi:MAG: hypothetical protein IKF19_05830 [Bacilli bacterium]|nr:hypothetical protein [Bacilli bacterium]
MKNKELLNNSYKYFNRYITADELIESLNNIDKKSLSKKELHMFDKLIKEIEKITKKFSNEEDELINMEKEKLKKIIKKFEKIPKDNECEDFLNKQLKDFKKDYYRKRDPEKKWLAITNYITNNSYFNTCFENLSDYELLEFIAKYIKAPFPPKLSEEELDNLVKVGIENDEREWLWRLAFTYEEESKILNQISDYFIDKKDGYYLAELISAVGYNLDIENIIDKIADKSLIKDLKKRKSVIKNYISEEQFNKLFRKLD